jgi:hypothetical protein
LRDGGEVDLIASPERPRLVARLVGDKVTGDPRSSRLSKIAHLIMPYSYCEVPQATLVHHAWSIFSNADPLCCSNQVYCSNQDTN